MTSESHQLLIHEKRYMTKQSKASLSSLDHWIWTGMNTYERESQWVWTNLSYFSEVQWQLTENDITCWQAVIRKLDNSNTMSALHSFVVHDG